MRPDLWNGRRVLLTGHTGFKGSWLVQILHALGADICGYALAPDTNPSLFGAARIAQLCRSHIGDIRDRANFAAAVRDFKPEVVFHLAAQPLVRASYRDPYETYSVNVMGLISVFEALREASGLQCIVNVTSDKCYDNFERERGYRETDPMGGHDPYSSSKGCAELITASWRRSFFAEAGILVASARAGNVIGGGDWAEDRLVPDFIRAVEKGRELVIRSPGARRPWQHVLEPLSGYICLAEQLLLGKSACATGWNFGPEDESVCHVEWIARTICALWGGNARYAIAAENILHEADTLKLDIQKAREGLDWTPRWTIAEALSKIVRWHKAFNEGQDARALCMTDITDFYQANPAMKGPIA